MKHHHKFWIVSGVTVVIIGITLYVLYGSNKGKHRKAGDLRRTQERAGRWNRRKLWKEDKKRKRDTQV